MMNEFLEVLTPTGETTGLVKSRDEIHRDGTWHYSVHVWLVDHTRTLLQKRALTKECYPGLYDVSAAGHVQAGETCKEAAVRETYEELNIEIPEESLIFVGIRKLCIANPEKSFLSNEYNYIYVVPVVAERCEFKLQTDEVSEIRWEEVQTLYRDIKASKPEYCIDQEELEMLRTLRSGM